MKAFNRVKGFATLTLALAVLGSCTKLNENLKSTLTSAQVAQQPGSTDLLVAGAYADLGGLFTAQDLLFSLEENATDESLVPTRGGDWDDNGVWRVVHSHSWTADHSQILNVFNSLNKLNFDATNILLFNPSASQSAQARFLRALALYYQLDLYGQYPLRQPGEDLRKAPEVKTGADAIDFLISELTAVIPDLPTTSITIATPDAARTLLMRCYLNKGAYLNRATPTFDAGDMQQVITLGNAIINSGKYSFSHNFFDNFSVTNDTSREAIFTYPNTSGLGTNNSGIAARWNMTLHYNSYTPVNPNAGWNGFSTISDFYNTFNVTATPTAFGPSDTAFDPRIGGRFYKGATDISGLRPGFLVGQQYNQNGQLLHDRKWDTSGGKKPDINTHLLSYNSTIAANMIETGDNLEITGIRVVKYPPDYTSGGKYYGGPAGNDLLLLRYADVMLMVAEAYMRTGDNASGLALVNQLRTARGASTFTSLPLVNTANVDDPNTFLAERGRELYWEEYRRTDLIRFGVFLKPWGLKPTDDPKNLLYPIPNQALAADPNLIQNPGY